MAAITTASGRAAAWRSRARSLVGNRRAFCAACVILGSVFVFWALWPVLGIPLHADDFNLFAFWTEARLRGSWWANLAPDQLFVGPRVVPTGLAALWLWLEATFRVGETFGIPLDLVWRLWRLVLPLAAIAAAAAFATAWGLVPWALRGARDRRRVRLQHVPLSTGESFSVAYLAVALITGAAIQVHLLWSSDPVTAFGLAGWGTTTLLFGFLALVPRALGDRSPRGALCLGAATFVGVLSVWYYELLLLPVALVALLVLILVVERVIRGSRRAALSFAWRGGCLALIPLAAFAGARIAVVDRLTGDANYDGTVPRLGAAFVETWFAGSLSALPASGWNLTRSSVGSFVGSDHLTLAAILVTLLLVGLAAITLRYLSRAPAGGRDVPADEAARPFGLGPRAALVLLLCVWLGTAGIQSATVKYQNEMAGVIGRVYLFYAPASIAVALLLGIAVVWLSGRRSAVPFAVVMAVLAIFATQQLSANTKLAEVGSAGYASEGMVIHAYQDTRQTSEADAERCAALAAWRRSERWQLADQERYFQDAFRLTNGFSMCRSDGS